VSVRLGAEYLWHVLQVTIPLRTGVFYDPEPGAGDTDDFFGFALGSGLTLGKFLFDIAYVFRAGTIQSTVTDTTVSQHTFVASVIYHF
jgi:hypothetical protein